MSKTTKPPLKPPSMDSPLGPQLLRDYGAYFENETMSDEEKTAFLVPLWEIMVIIADFGIGLGPMPSNINQSGTEKRPEFRIDVLSLLNPKDTSHETVAPRLTNNEKEQSP